MYVQSEFFLPSTRKLADFFPYQLAFISNRVLIKILEIKWIWLILLISLRAFSTFKSERMVFLFKVFSVNLLEECRIKARTITICVGEKLKPFAVLSYQFLYFYRTWCQYKDTPFVSNKRVFKLTRNYNNLIGHDIVIS